MSLRDQRQTRKRGQPSLLLGRITQKSGSVSDGLVRYAPKATEVLRCRKLRWSNRAYWLMDMMAFAAFRFSRQADLAAAAYSQCRRRPSNRYKMQQGREVEHGHSRHSTSQDPSSGPGSASEGLAGGIGRGASERSCSKRPGRHLSSLRRSVLADEEREEPREDDGVCVGNVRPRRCS